MNVKHFPKKVAVGLIASTMFATVGLSTVSAAVFPDVAKSSPHYVAVTDLSTQNIMRGYQDGRFGLWDQMTRQPAAQIMARTLKLKSPANADVILKDYKDISTRNPAHKEIAAVVQAGILKGSNGYFNPAAEITREQAATMLVRGMQLQKINRKKIPCNLKGVSKAHQANVQILVDLRITTAVNDFKPGESISRGAFASMLHRSLEVLKTGAALPAAGMNPAPSNKPTAPKPVNAEAQARTFEKRVITLTNKERTNRGLKALKSDSQLHKTALEKSRDMAKNDYFDHYSPKYGTPFELMRQYGITKYKAAGENIALGYATPEDVVSDWMKSKDHRVNILSKDYTNIGVGYEPEGGHWTQHFTGN